MESIALTGGIGCGKSTVLKFFQALGWTVLDADGICHELYDAPDPELSALLKKRWGENVLNANGAVNRKFLGQQVFDHADGLADLNRMIHPRILEWIEERQKHASAGEFLMVDAPLLFESGWNTRFGIVVSVWASPEKQKKRLLERGWSPEHIEKRLAAQFPAVRKLEQADYGLITNYDLPVLERQCVLLDRILKQKIS